MYFEKKTHFALRYSRVTYSLSIHSNKLNFSNFEYILHSSDQTINHITLNFRTLNFYVTQRITYMIQTYIWNTDVTNANNHVNHVTHVTIS